MVVFACHLFWTFNFPRQQHSMFGAGDSTETPAVDISPYAAEEARSWPLTLFFALVTFYLCNWVLYQVMLKIWCLSDSIPICLEVLTYWLDDFFHPCQLEPFSCWLNVVVIFLLWALPDSIIRVAPDLFDTDDSDDENVEEAEDLYVVLCLHYMCSLLFKILTIH